MKRLTGLLCVCILALACVGPVRAATLVAQAAPQQAAHDTGSVSGTIHDNTGAPVADARITLKGPGTYRTTSDAAGHFEIAGVEAGFYSFTASKAGYNTATEPQMAVFTGETKQLVVRMSQATLTSLRTIASVRAVGRGTFNTSTAAVQVVSSQVFTNQGQLQVTRVLNQIPDVQISFPGGSANGAVAGAITVPTIRGANSFETQSMIDGHPLAVGRYGDYVTTFLNPYMLRSVQVVKGPGALVPQINGAIGGTINFRTKDPTLKPEGNLVFGVDNHGGNFSNFGVSDTTLHGRLGFVFDLSSIDTPSAFGNYQALFDPTNGNSFINGNAVNNYQNSYSRSVPVPGTSSTVPSIHNLVACCYTVTGDFTNVSELMKVRYRLSPVTYLMASYLGSQSTADQTGNTGNGTIGSSFAPGPGYTGSLAPGPLQVFYLYPGSANIETNNEPMFQAQASSTIGTNTVLARFYHASIWRLVDEGSAPNTPGVNFVHMYGTGCSSYVYSSSCASSHGTPIQYNGGIVPLAVYDFYDQTELDKLMGYSFEIDHPIGYNNMVALSFDTSKSTSQAYTNSAFSSRYAPPYSLSTSTSIPAGSSQITSTIMLRGHFLVSPKMTANAALYDNLYSTTYGVCSHPSYACGPDGSNYAFTDQKLNHFDGRFAFEYRPAENIAVRLSAGSSIAPPYLGLITGNGINGRGSYSSTAGIFTVPSAPTNLNPESAFGYDLGADYRLHDGITVLSGDIYRTNMFNKFFGQTTNSGLLCGTSYTCTPSSGPAPPAGTPVYLATTVNLSHARYQGLEFTLRHFPRVGIGFTGSVGLEQGYVYDLPAYFYCGTPSPNCTPNQNLGVIAGQNFTSGGIGTGFGSTIGSMNTSIPYMQGNAAISYTSRKGLFLQFGETLYGKNNSLNEPPFAIGYATVRVPLGNQFAAQVSGDNIFNTDQGLYPIYGGGVPIPIYGGRQAATTGNVLGPATFRFEITKVVGGL